MKRTLLSLCGKLQVPEFDCEVLGYHIPRGATSKVTYDRSALAGPLRSLEKATAKVRSGEFLPDESYSGKLVPDPAKRIPIQKQVEQRLGMTKDQIVAWLRGVEEAPEPCQDGVESLLGDEDGGRCFGCAGNDRPGAGSGHGYVR